MKQLLIVLCALVFSAVGCVSTQPQYRGVSGNKYLSSSPKMTVIVSNEYSHIESNRRKRNRRFSSGNGSYFQTDETHDFFKVKDKRVRSGVAIEYNEMSKGYWFPNVLENVKPAFADKIITVDSQSYYYKCALVKSHVLLDEEVIQKLTDQKVITPSYFLVHAIGKRFGTDNRVKMYITYFEDFNSNGTSYTSKDWENTSLLTDAQKKQLRGLKERGNKAFKLHHAFNGLEPITPPQIVQSESQGVKESVRARLKALKQYLDEGIITQEDYDEQKAKALKDL